MRRKNVRRGTRKRKGGKGEEKECRKGEKKEKRRNVYREGGKVNKGVKEKNEGRLRLIFMKKCEIQKIKKEKC